MELAFKSTNEGSLGVPAQNMLQSHELDLIGIGLQAKEEPRLGEQANAGSRAIDPSPEAAEAAADASLTSSGLLAKHNANIARLAQSFGLSMENLDQEGRHANKQSESQEGIFN